MTNTRPLPLDLYDLYMKEVPVSEARERLADLIEESRRSSEPVSLTRRGKAVAVLVAPAVFEQLSQDAEDAVDRAAALMAVEDEDFIPWEEVKAELGLS